jgi:hypothetical protein
MRVDYEQHFAQCEYCRQRQRFHRIIDFGLLAVRHFFPTGGFIMQMVALAGVVLSAAVWVIVCMTTPVPVMVFGAVRTQARRIHERLPNEIKAKIPEHIAARITS